MYSSKINQQVPQTNSNNNIVKLIFYKLYFVVEGSRVDY